MAYRVVTYMRVDPEELVLFDTREEAEAEIAHWRTLHPEDRYEIEEIGADFDATHE